MNLEIKEIQRKATPILKAARVSRAAVFGSAVRGETSVTSDIDMLVELPEGETLLGLIELKLKLEEALGREVDLLTYRSLSPYLADTIQKEQVQIV